MTRARRTSTAAKAGLAVLTVVILAWTLFPVYYMLLLSFTLLLATNFLQWWTGRRQAA